MFNRLRELRKSRGLTLAEVAARCDPPTTAVTIGRLETGARQLTVAWIERISAALGVEATEILASENGEEIPVAAQLMADGAKALPSPLTIRPPTPAANMIGLLVHDSCGEYRSGDQLWLQQIPPERFFEAINSDILAPRAVGRFVFGRLVAIDSGRLHILPSTAGSRQIILASPPWIAQLHYLIRRA